MAVDLIVLSRHIRYPLGPFARRRAVLLVFNNLPHGEIRVDSVMNRKGLEVADIGMLHVNRGGVL